MNEDSDHRNNPIKLPRDLERVISAFEQCFGENSLNFDGKNAAQAAAYAQGEQLNYYRKVFDFVITIGGNPRGDRIDDQIDGFWDDFLQNAVSTVERKIIESDDSTAVLSGNGPVIGSRIVEDLTQALGFAEDIEFADQEALGDFRLLFVGYLAIRFRHRNVSADVFWNRRIARHVHNAISQIIVFRTIRSSPNAIRSEVNALQTEIDGQRSLVNDYGEKLDAYPSQMDELQEKLKSNQASTENLTSEVNTTKERMEALTEELKDAIGLSETEDLWAGRIKMYRWSFGVSAVILVALLLGIPFVIWSYRLDVIEFVKSIELIAISQTPARNPNPVESTFLIIGRLAIVGIPAAFVAWLIRIVVRFNLRSMLLLDDARQRHTMLSTYLFLVRQRAADTSDRAAVLEALFRRPPGHGADTVEPPDFVDLLKFTNPVGGGRGGN